MKSVLVEDGIPNNLTALPKHREHNWVHVLLINGYKLNRLFWHTPTYYVVPTITSFPPRVSVAFFFRSSVFNQFSWSPSISREKSSHQLQDRKKKLPSSFMKTNTSGTYKCELYTQYTHTYTHSLTYSIINQCVSIATIYTGKS